MSTTRHPRALPYLFLTEMWERFGFYVVQGMLVLYMTKVFGFSDDDSFTITGTFTALVYISPLVGGLLADRVLGFKQAIIWGGFFLIAGYSLLVLPYHQTFYLSLAVIIVGNGLFKPNISSLLGALYSPGNPARESGFTIFYIGINIGVLLAGVSSGYVKDHFGWQAGFGLASVGLIFGLIIFSLGVKIVGMTYPHTTSMNRRKWLAKPLLFFYCLMTIVAINFLLQINFLAKYLLPTIGLLLLIFLFRLASRQEPAYRQSLYTLIFLILSSIVFWGMFFQVFSSTTLFVDRIIDKTIFGITIPTTAFYALESVFVILLGPLFAWSWQSLNQSNHNPSSISKFILAIISIGLGFLVLAISTHYTRSDNLINPLWICLSYLLLTIGELLLSPIGLSSVTMLSPQHLVGMMMGVWFVGTGFGGLVAGVMAKLASVPTSIQNPIEMLPIYHHAFLTYAEVAFGVAILLFLFQLFFFRKKLST